MAQVWLLWWPKSNVSAVTATSVSRKASSSSSNYNRVAKLLRKLKKRGRVLCSTTGESSGAFQCRYDPLSYSLNFDTSGGGNLLDGHYYQFCAFSSRFASNPGNASHSHPALSDVTVSDSR